MKTLKGFFFITAALAGVMGCTDGAPPLSTTREGAEPLTVFASEATGMIDVAEVPGGSGTLHIDMTIPGAGPVYSDCAVDVVGSYNTLACQTKTFEIAREPGKAYIVKARSSASASEPDQITVRLWVTP